MAEHHPPLSDDLRAAYDAAPGPIAVYARTGELVYLNPRAQEDLSSGVEHADPDAILGRRWQDFDASPSAGFVDAFERVTAGDEDVVDIPWAASSVTGRAYRVRLWGSPSGLIHSFLTPIDSLVAGEVALRRFVTDFPFGACYIFDHQMRYIAAYGRGMEVRQQEPTELVGRLVADVWPRELMEQIETPYRRALQGEESNYVVRHEDRTYRNWASGIRNERGDITCGVVIVWDVTGDVEVQETLELIRKAIDALPLGVTLSTAEEGTPLVFANAGFVEMSGWDPEEARGRDFRFLFGLEDADPDAVARIATAVKEGRAAQEAIYSRRRDGSGFWNRFTVGPIRAGGREITHFIGIQEDVTEQRRTGQELEMSRRLGSLGQLAGGLAHDMRNVLTGTGLVIDLLTERDDLPAEVLEDLRKVHGVVDRGAAITDRLLSFAREHTFERTRLDLADFIEDRTPLLRTLLRESVSIEVETPGSGLWILGNAGQLDQVILNLATNAESAMPTGGSLRIDVRGGVSGDALGVDRGTRQTSAEEPASWAVVRFSDTGVGMSESVRKRAFEPFFSTRKTEGGTGLGLASVYGVVQGLGGACWIESTEGEGTTVHLAFPEVDPIDTTPSSTPTAPEGLRGTRVLLAEDDDAIRRACGRFLESRGAVVTAVPDGGEGRRELEADPGGFDLVITDAVMPSVSGPELIASARAIDPELPCVLVSGYTDVILGEDLEGVRMLEKPFTMQVFASTIDEVLDPGGGAD